MLNIAEGSGRYTKPDKRNFYVISRGSAFECVAILDYLHDNKMIESVKFNSFYIALEEISKMLYSLIKGLSNWSKSLSAGNTTLGEIRYTSARLPLELETYLVFTNKY